MLADVAAPGDGRTPVPNAFCGGSVQQLKGGIPSTYQNLPGPSRAYQHLPSASLGS
jgi:hypothetical protein